MPRKKTMPESATVLNTPFTLPCGVTLKNRIAKGAMTEGLSDESNNAKPSHARLYQRWADGGTGLLITGNVMVDRRYLERPGNIAIDGKQTNEQLSALKDLSRSGQGNGTSIWVQLNHAGRQTPDFINPHPVGPSAVQTHTSGAKFGLPRVLEEQEIQEIIQRFGHAADVAKQTGFDGVQIHSAHGYLLSSFLNPNANKRQDQWGGSLQNRARLLRETVRCVRENVGPEYPVSVKLNSSDFQKGGFSNQDCIQVAQWLLEEGIDLLEISGGNYESPAMVDLPEEKQRETTRRREAYFLEFAQMLHTSKTPPLMVTGGNRTRQAMEKAIDQTGVSIIGIARPLCGQPDGPNLIFSGATGTLQKMEEEVRIGPGILGFHSPFKFIAQLNGWGQLAWCVRQMHEMSKGRQPNWKFSALGSFIWLEKHNKRILNRMKGQA
ncbi:MAG TPA: NADH:flavin oxidoreductase/NADH oxidase family protein [Sphingomonadales bacterium]|nr:NADH:flavin oxidoreductase/NADH oxidase family protein [Sphingomonadales bacterium]